MNRASLPGYLADYMEALLHEAQLKSGIAACTALVSGLLGGAGALINLLILLMGLDYALGFLRAWQLRRISRAKMGRGAVKMVASLLAVVVMAAIDAALVSVTPLHLPVRDVFVAYLCLTEGLSCLEHLAHFGVRIPDPLRDRLRSYRDNICLPAGSTPARGTER